MHIDELYQAYVEKVYQQTQGGQTYTSSEQQAFLQSQVCITYGELLYPSVKKMLRHANMTAEDVFLDLGSGLGKCTLQAFIQTKAHKVIGIEAATRLHEQAQKIVAQVQQDAPYLWEEQREWNLLCDNFLTANWQGATVVYICSTCFTQSLLNAIGNKINTEPQVQKVLSLRPLPTLQMPLQKVFSVECSWDSALCFFYAKV